MVKIQFVRPVDHKGRIEWDFADDPRDIPERPLIGDEVYFREWKGDDVFTSHGTIAHLVWEFEDEVDGCQLIAFLSPMTFVDGEVLTLDDFGSLLS